MKFVYSNRVREEGRFRKISDFYSLAELSSAAEDVSVLGINTEAMAEPCSCKCM